MLLDFPNYTPGWLTHKASPRVPPSLISASLLWRPRHRSTPCRVPVFQRIQESRPVYISLINLKQDGEAAILVSFSFEFTCYDAALQRQGNFMRVKSESIWLCASRRPPCVLRALPADYSVGRANVVFQIDFKGKLEIRRWF